MASTGHGELSIAVGTCKPVAAEPFAVNIGAVRARHDTGLENKLKFLRSPAGYPGPPRAVDVVETHFSWVFLAGAFVYKLKKPIRFHGLDYRTLAQRKASCELEVSLNRRLADEVYIGAVPLCRSGAALRLESGGTPVDWLVKMHRLQRSLMLDAKAAAGTVAAGELEAVMRRLAAFYRTTDKAPWTAAEYRQAIEAQLRWHAEQLAALPTGTNAERAGRLVAGQIAFVGNNAALLDARIAAGRVVDGHGDLRPEHVYLGARPQVIDCLEFSAELRWLDTAEEIGFLDLECERLGLAAVGHELCTLYRRHCDDPIAPALFAFYRSRRALARALVSAWHLEDSPPPETSRRWLERTDWYLRAAAACMQRAMA